MANFIFFKRTMACLLLSLMIFCMCEAQAALMSDLISRDPFTNTEVIYSEVGRSNDGSYSGGRGFIPSMGLGQTPKMELKGFVGGKQPLAMLEIEGVKRVYHVRQGDEIDLRIYKIPVVIQIVEVNKLGVKIRTGTFNQVLVVK